MAVWGSEVGERGFWVGLGAPWSDVGGREVFMFVRRVVRSVDGVGVGLVSGILVWIWCS